MHARAAAPQGPGASRRHHQRPGADGGGRLRHVARDQGEARHRGRCAHLGAEHRVPRAGEERARLLHRAHPQVRPPTHLRRRRVPRQEGWPLHAPHAHLRAARLMEHEEIRQAVRRYAREQLAPNAARWDRDKEFPREALKGLAAMGLYGISIAETLGGAGLDYSAMAIACEAIAAGDCATATIVAVNNLVAGIVNGYGSAVHKEKYPRPLARGELLGAFAPTEPQAGSDASAITTRAQRKEGHYVLNGGKQFIASGKNADMATQIEAARQLYLHAARLRSAGQPCIREASMAKLFASEMAERVCSDAIQIHGGYGYVADFPVERLWRDVRVTQIYEGASDIQRMVIGRTLEE